MVEKGYTLLLINLDRKALTDKIEIYDQRAILNLVWLGVNP